MSTNLIRLPQIGVTVEEATVVSWLCNLGERIVEGNSIVIIESEKAEMEIDSPVTGYVRSLVDVGTTVSIGDILGVVTDTPDESIEIED